MHVLADDADMFVMLVYLLWYYKPLAYISMRYNGNIIAITATVAKLGNKCSDLLSVHARSGCDTVSYLYGKVKMSTANLMLKFDLD